MKNALVFGATGLVGSLLLRELLADPDYGRATVVARRPAAIDDPRLEVVVADFATLPHVAARHRRRRRRTRDAGGHQDERRQGDDPPLARDARAGAPG